MAASRPSPDPGGHTAGGPVRPASDRLVVRLPSCPASHNRSSSKPQQPGVVHKDLVALAHCCLRLFASSAAVSATAWLVAAPARASERPWKRRRHRRRLDQRPWDLEKVAGVQANPICWIHLQGRAGWAVTYRGALASRTLRMGGMVGASQRRATAQSSLQR